jgi:hypothetical protein
LIIKFYRNGIIKSTIIKIKSNPIQFHLLELFSKGMSDKKLLEIKELLVKYYYDNVVGEVDAFWDKKELTKDKWEDMTKDIHFRSSKK